MIDKFPWRKHYPPGVVNEIDADKFENIPDFLDGTFKQFSERVAYVNMGKELTFREVDQLSSDFAAYLQHHTDLKVGDRIAVQMPNLLQYPIVIFGILKAGMVVVNTNPLYTPREMKHQFSDSGAKGIIVLTNFASNLEKIIDETDITTIIKTEMGDMLGGLKGMITNFVVKNVKKMVPAFSLPQAIPFKETLKIGKKSTYNHVDIHASDIAFLQYTGGTTGVSKGAMLSHRNLIANMEQTLAWMGPYLTKEVPEVVITPLPLYHIFALTVNCLSMLQMGAKNVLITNPRDMKAFIKDLATYPFTFITGVNTLFNGLLTQDAFKALDFSNLKASVGGGMAVQDYVAHQWEKVTGQPLIEGYGLTETSPVVSCNPLGGSQRIGTIGLVYPSTELEIRDENGIEVPQGTIGEIVAKGPQVMLGYWNRKEETDLVLKDGWLNTGDMGLIDEDGFTKIVDRKKEMINVSGFNVYPNEIENVIAELDDVLEVAAIGIDDPKSTEVVKVFIVKKNLDLTAEKVTAYCKENLTGYKIPRQIEFRKDLPKSNIGKILRRVLKEEETAKNS